MRAIRPVDDPGGFNRVPGIGVAPGRTPLLLQIALCRVVILLSLCFFRCRNRKDAPHLQKRIVLAARRIDLRP